MFKLKENTWYKHLLSPPPHGSNCLGLAKPLVFTQLEVRRIYVSSISHVKNSVSLNNFQNSCGPCSGEVPSRLEIVAVCSAEDTDIGTVAHLHTRACACVCVHACPCTCKRFIPQACQRAGMPATSNAVLGTEPGH